MIWTPLSCYFKSWRLIKTHSSLSRLVILAQCTCIHWTICISVTRFNFIWITSEILNDLWLGWNLSLSFTQRRIFASFSYLFELLLGLRSVIILHFSIVHCHWWRWGILNVQHLIQFLQKIVILWNMWLFSFCKCLHHLLSMSSALTSMYSFWLVRSFWNMLCISSALIR